MMFGNNILQDGAKVQVIEFRPPTEGGSEGLLYVRCPTLDKYEELRRFVDEEHGSALMDGNGGRWYVHRISDDGRRDLPFPQEVAVKVRWLMQ